MTVTPPQLVPVLDLQAEVTAERRERLEKLWESGIRYRRELAKALGCCRETVESDLADMGLADRVKPDRDALRARDERARLGERRTLTGMILGDPEPGRSALDQKGQQA